MSVQMRKRKEKSPIANSVLGGNDGEQVDYLLLTDLKPFQNHPFKIVEDDNFQELKESIQNHRINKNHPINTPIIVRPLSYGKFEIISGHRRVKACEQLGIKNIPAFIRDLDDEEAIFQMVDTNIHREQLLPSEKAFAYKMKLEAIKRKAGRPEKKGMPVAHNLDGKKSADIIAEDSGTSKDQVRRYIRLTELITPILDMVDSKKLPFQTAVEISYLKAPEQTELLEVIGILNLIPTLEQAKSLKKVSLLEGLSRTVIETYLQPTDEKPKKISLKVESSRYFPQNTPKEEIEQVIHTHLEEWHSKQAQTSQATAETSEPLT